MGSGQAGFDEYSQFGEDGILQAVFSELGTRDGVLIEVGAWNGKYLSNCYRLLTQGWTGIHIEADEQRFVDLSANVEPFNSTAICATVGPTGRPLTEILEEADAPDHVDLLSIDIDSDDLAVLSDYCDSRSAAVICVEFNPTIPSDVVFINTPGEAWGNSALALVKEATRRSYRLVAYTFCNLIFVRDTLADPFRIQPLSNPGASGHLRTWWGYDGSIFMARIEDAERDPYVRPADRVVPPWGQPSFPQPVAAEDRKWPSPANDRLAAERDSLIRDRDEWVAHAEALAVERDDLLAERSALVAHSDALAVERDDLLAERSTLLAHAAALENERDDLIRDRDEWVAHAEREPTTEGFESAL